MIVPNQDLPPRRSSACQNLFFDRLVDGEILSPPQPPLDRFHLNPSDSGREICKEAIFLPENVIFLHKNSRERDVHAAALDFFRLSCTSFSTN